LNGDFGNFNYRYHSSEGLKSQEFFARKITFKSSPEHTHTHANAEMLVHHVSRDGQKAIVSFLLEADNHLERPNDFIDELQPDLWSNEKDFEFELDQPVNLNNIVEGGAR